MVRKSAIDRFLSKVIIKESGCHEWTARLSEKGYGVFRDIKSWQAHRWSYQYTNGTIPDGMYVLHKCDNRKCVNHEHLYLGTQFDNMRDMWERGRGVRSKGTDHPKTYLTDNQVANIKALALIGLQPDLLARIFKSNSTTIWYIIKEKTWKHIATPILQWKRNREPEAPSKARKKRRAINMLSLDGKFIKRFNGITEAAEFIKRDPTGFREVVHGRQSTWGGYKWEYARQDKDLKNTILM